MCIVIGETMRFNFIHKINTEPSIESTTTMNALSPAHDQDNSFEFNSFEFPPLVSYEETSEDAIAALCEQLQMIRDENRMRWGEHHHGATIEDDDCVVDILKGFKDDPNDDGDEKEGVNHANYGKRTPLRSLTNETKSKGVKKTGRNRGKNRKSKSKGKRNKTRRPKKKSNKSSVITDTHNDLMTLGTKYKFINNGDDNTSKQSIGISKPTYKINDFGVDHSLVLNFALPEALEPVPTVPVQTVYEESPTNSVSTVGLENGLDVIEEAEEEVDESPIKSECNKESNFSTDDQVGMMREEGQVLEAEEAMKRTSPLLSSTSFQDDHSIYYNDETLEDKQDQLCSSNNNCTFFSRLITLFTGQKKSQNCLICDANHL